MIRTLILSVALALATGGAQADGRTQLLENVSRDLHRYVNGVNPEDLSTHQLGAIYATIHSSASESRKRRMIRSMVGGGYSLRSLIFN
ncbi:hypothetical protein [Pseudoruegeria sp. HB172150]|uniref:hypothetical protein n=1 Tax=Pseudoruegeria sp. HB172150 TaxID=2721164 RepID=UPI0015525F3F|nr:hypothetical protein [Pseudoruegeria sp. HB172150]